MTRRRGAVVGVFEGCGEPVGTNDGVELGLKEVEGSGLARWVGREDADGRWDETGLGWEDVEGTGLGGKEGRRDTEG